MKRTIKLTIVAAFSTAVIFMVWLSASPAAAAINAEASSPRGLYTQNCARCHGADGKAQTALGKKLGADDISGGLSTAKTIRVVTNGRKKMPSFKRKLSAAQIASIAGYVQSL